MTKEDIEVLSAIDLDEYYVDKIVAHEDKGRNPKNWKFKDGLDMSQKMIHGSIGQRSKISLRWIPIAANIRSCI